MSLSMSCALFQEHRVCPSVEQSCLLLQTLSLRQKLKEPSFPNALRGLRGLAKADSILRERNGVGLLIGGLAESIWNKNRTDDELSEHKDVDVLVATPKLSFEDFEGGIDWWNMEKVNFDSLWLDGSAAPVINVERKFWVNGNGCALMYRIESLNSLDPGLYLPSPSLAIEIRVVEIFASIASSVKVIEEDEKLFRERLAKKLGIKTRLPYFLHSKFKEMIVSSEEFAGREFSTAFRVESITLTEQAALNSKSNYRVGPKQ